MRTVVNRHFLLGPSILREQIGHPSLESFLEQHPAKLSGLLVDRVVWSVSKWELEVALVDISKSSISNALAHHIGGDNGVSGFLCSCANLAAPFREQRVWWESAIVASYSIST